MKKLSLTSWQLSLAASVYIVTANNAALLVSLIDGPEPFSLNGIGLLLAIVALMVFVTNTILLTFGIGCLQKPLTGVFLIATATLGYFANEIGVVFDESMFLNIAATVRDGNSAEALELASLPLIGHVLAFGVVPSLMLLFIAIRPKTLCREIGTRALVTVVGLTLVVAILLPTYKYDSFFATEHPALRFRVMPIFPLVSLVKLARDAIPEQRPFHVIDADAFQRRTPLKRSIGIMVVGETARADHFSMNGYGKRTNPTLDITSNVAFAQADSCGTSTLFSVPCMFSMRGRDTYEPYIARTESNVLDILTAAGVQTVWLDNNSSCNNICDRIENINLRQNLNKASPFYTPIGYFDEVLLDAVEPYLEGDGPDLLIVLHELGSHGPAYNRRYPAQFSVFTPSCDELSPTKCSKEMVSNAYDNTLVYTDYLLTKLIEKLKSRSDDIDAFLFYASDHGESLGENGVYLHGLPYSIAPLAQTQVPFIVWLSPEFQKRHRVNSYALEQLHEKELSHDNISHTLLGFFDVSASSYRADLDMFSHAA